MHPSLLSSNLPMLVRSRRVHIISQQICFSCILRVHTKRTVNDLRLRVLLLLGDAARALRGVWCSILMGGSTQNASSLERKARDPKDCKSAERELIYRIFRNAVPPTYLYPLPKYLYIMLFIGLTYDLVLLPRRTKFTIERSFDVWPGLLGGGHV